MTDHVLLSDLCSICNNKAPKYRCPRCATQTCSLPCYKRHQAWAQCSGKRDPTTFVSKSRLTTAAGIDHDFNFLASIEQAFEKAEEKSQDVGLEVSNSKRFEPSKDSGFRQHLDKTGVFILKAPTGMTRQKENNTNWSKKHRMIMWTVEWSHQDRGRDLDRVREDIPLVKAYADHLHSKLILSKKRKRDSTEVVDNPSSSNTRKESLTPHDTSAKEQSPKTCEDITSIVQKMYFYLVKPRTSGSKDVLIPVQSSEPLSQCLKDRTILEFPTIFALQYPPTDLPEPYVLEKAYLEQSRQDMVELQQIVAEADSSSLLNDHHSQTPNDSKNILNSQKILQVLKQDVRSLT
ncbi:hypothetical protein M501DRAFT_1013764 [Patellaria atrata CBS 101060]|uniref:Box C/D snoRNA protein 1 n=1 Tax=Patellaria atrata CBS 101060 TaxID=1346257 RepID=A0A9P4SGD4_9PEZI|nr:hypothetical protein M501DRAFT_1013764 [Patellaria atrata CBS 101060]